MRKLPKVSERYFLGEWNHCQVNVDHVNDTAEITILDGKTGRRGRFKIQGYSKAEKEWKIIEDSDA